MSSNLSKFLESFDQEIKEKQREEEIENLFNNKEEGDIQQKNDAQRKQVINQQPASNQHANNQHVENQHQPIANPQVKRNAPNLKLNLKRKNRDNSNHPEEPNLGNGYANSGIAANRNVSPSANMETNTKINMEINRNVAQNADGSEDIPFNKDAQVEIFFILSETPKKFKEKWYDLYNKAISSNKNTMINDKVRRGKFRFNETGSFEVLPEYETNGKTSKQLLHETWTIKE